MLPKDPLIEAMRANAKAQIAAEWKKKLDEAMIGGNMSQPPPLKYQPNPIFKEIGEYSGAIVTNGTGPIQYPDGTTWSPPAKPAVIAPLRKKVRVLEMPATRKIEFAD